MQGIKNYKKYVEEHKDDFKHKNLFSRHRDFSLVSPKISDLEIRNFDSMYTKSYTYFTEEPTEKPSGKNNYDTPISQTKPPAEIYTKCPSSVNSTTYIPTINFTIRNFASTNNNNNNNYIILITTFSLFSFFIFLFTIYFYKYYYLKYVKKNKDNKIDLDFGITYVDDF
jgi:hypothetical protein